MTETQNNVRLDPTGHYSVQLEITNSAGVPTTLIHPGRKRAGWSQRIAERGEQPPGLLRSVPYALKAGDAATVGGLPPSAFVLATPGNGSAAYASPSLIGSTAAQECFAHCGEPSQVFHASTPPTPPDPSSAAPPSVRLRDVPHR